MSSYTRSADSSSDPWPVVTWSASHKKLCSRTAFCSRFCCHLFIQWKGFDQELCLFDLCCSELSQISSAWIQNSSGNCPLLLKFYLISIYIYACAHIVLNAVLTYSCAIDICGDDIHVRHQTPCKRVLEKGVGNHELVSKFRRLIS